MTLDNLLGKSLEHIEPDELIIKRLLEAAQRNIQDAKLQALSNENRFDAAYKAIMQMANAALQASGYRTLTSSTGHHQTMIQSLPKTVDLDRETMIVLDTLRKQRNLSDYSGDPITESAVSECLRQAEMLFDVLVKWFENIHPGLLE